MSADVERDERNAHRDLLREVRQFVSDEADYYQDTDALTGIRAVALLAKIDAALRTGEDRRRA